MRILRENENLSSADFEQATAQLVKIEQRRAALEELRGAMEKRDNAAAEAARLAAEEAQLVAEIEEALKEKATTFAEAEAQAAVLESARADWEAQERIAQGNPGAENPSLQEARRNLSAAITANDTAAREARVVADGVTRAEERLAGVGKRRGEMRYQQTIFHEAFEKLARTVRVFTQEALAEALAEANAAWIAQEKIRQAMREAGLNPTAAADSSKPGNP